MTSVDLGGRTLPSGVHCLDTSAGLAGTLTLDGLGDPNAVFVSRIGSTLTTASRSAVTPIGSAQASITLNNGASLHGRALARMGAVTLDTNVVTTP